MAEKRMFAKTIVLSDAFLDMPMSARCLYFTFGMLADDDGFVSSPKGIMRQCGASMDDLNILIAKRYVLAFDSGIIVIKHWRINNYLRQDRYTPTTYVEEKETLSLDAKGAYVEAGEAASGIPPGIPLVDHPVYPDKDREDKDRLEEDRLDQEREDNGTLSDESVCRPEDVRRVVDAWQTLGIQKLRKIPDSTTNAGKMLRARIRDYGIGSVLEAIEIVRASDFLMGRVKDFQITFDWFVRPNNFLNIVNGKYDNRDKPEAKTRQGREMQSKYDMMQKWSETYADDT